jgi:hypothetical protein
MKAVKFTFIAVIALFFIFILFAKKEYKVENICGYGKHHSLLIYYGVYDGIGPIADIELGWGLLGDDKYCHYGPIEKNYLHISSQLNIGDLHIDINPITTWGPPIIRE